VVSAGQCIGLIDDIPTCAELISRMVSDCQNRIEATSKYFV
jgi:nitronate monooxygenase